MSTVVQPQIKKVVKEAAAVEISYPVRFAIGGLSGIVAATSIYPLDIVKTRLQHQRAGSAIVYNGMIDCFRKTYADGGIRALYR